MACPIESCPYGDNCMHVPQVTSCTDCGWPEGSFACRIRHVHLNTGDAKAANDHRG